jgi:hypothetical protein
MHDKVVVVGVSPRVQFQEVSVGTGLEMLGAKRNPTRKAL